MPSITCELTVDVYGGPKGQHLLLADIDVSVEVDVEAYPFCGVRVEDVYMSAPEWGPDSDPLTRPAECEFVRPPEWLAHAIANIINSSEKHRRRIDDAIRDAGGADALHERARAGQAMKRAAEG